MSVKVTGWESGLGSSKPVKAKDYRFAAMGFIGCIDDTLGGWSQSKRLRPLAVELKVGWTKVPLLQSPGRTNDGLRSWWCYKTHTNQNAGSRDTSHTGPMHVGSS